jgi:hypothetical protein
MKLEEIKEVLNSVSFAPSNLNMGWSWDVKSTKIYDNGVVFETGYSIRTTFMRPDVNTGEVEKGYGRWMYVPENISKDGLVKTAWLCAELIIKHELMEAFLYNKTRIFDPHKSLNDLSYNGRIVDDNNVSEEIKEPQVESYSPKSETEPEKPSTEVFQKQNIELHYESIKEFLDDNFNKSNDESKGDKYIIDEYMIFNYRDGLIQLAEKAGKIVDYRSEEKYNLSDVKDMLDPILKRVKLADPAIVNQMIHIAGFTQGKSLQEDQGTPYWVFSNPANKTRYVYHSETEKSFVLVNENNDILKALEGDEYTIDNIKSILK